MMEQDGQDVPIEGPDRSTIFLRPIGTPMPLGLVGLAVSAAALSCFQLGWARPSEQHQAAIVLLAFAFPLQGLAAVLLFLARDAPAGAGMGVLSCSWLTLGLLLLTSPPGSRSALVAVFLLAAAAALLPGVISLSMSKLVPAGIMLLSATKLVLTGLYEKIGGTGWEHAAGWEGVVLAAAALYGAFASDLESEMHHTVLPMGRWGLGRRAIRQGLDGQVGQLEREPGIRTQT